jgi:hypothetical protein
MQKRNDLQSNWPGSPSSPSLKFEKCASSRLLRFVGTAPSASFSEALESDRADIEAEPVYLVKSFSQQVSHVMISSELLDIVY